MPSIPAPKICESCGDGFSCGAGSGSCWCFELPVADAIPEKYGECLCEKCLKSFTTKEATTTEAHSSGSLVEGTDYYINKKGLMVFTEAFHLKRGYCCKSNCQHCPY